MIYLASPYSSKDPAIQQRRYISVCKAAAELMRRGVHVFSPIAHSWSVAEHGNLHGDFAFWQEIDFEWIRMCGAVWVYTLKGWQNSVGVQAETRYAECMQISIKEISPASLGLDDVEA